MPTSFLLQDQDGQELYSTISSFSQINDVKGQYTELIPSVRWNCLSHNNRNVLIICYPQQIPYYLSNLKNFILERFTNITIWHTNLEITDKNQRLKEVDQVDAVICFVTELLTLTQNVIGDDLIPIIKISVSPNFR